MWWRTGNRPEIRYCSYTWPLEQISHRMKELINFHKNWLGFHKYYEIILSNKANYPTELNQNKRLLNGIELDSSIEYTEFDTKTNDHRIDAPVWFGTLRNTKNRILVFGLEPRDTNSKFNLERVDNLVFGTPFGIDRWNSNSSVTRKPQNRYYRVFDEISNRKDTFLIFSDIVKTYKILDKENNDRINDEYARNNFFKKARESKTNLLKEISIINPTHIVTLGHDSTRIVKELLPEKQSLITGIRHPANGGETQAKNQIYQLLCTS